MRLGPRSAAALALALAAAAAPVNDAAAQGWFAEARAGEVRYGVGPSALGSTNVSLGLRYHDARRWLQVASGVPLDAEDPFWGAAAGGARLQAGAGATRVGIDFAGHAFLQRDRTARGGPPGVIGGPLDEPSLDGGGFSGEALPLLGIGWGMAELEGRAGAAAYRHDFGEESFTRVIGLADLALGVAPSTGFAAAAELRYAHADEGGYPYAGIRGHAGGARGLIWASAGRWLPDSIGTPEWAAGATLRILSRAHLSVATRSDTFDPLYLSGERRSWSVGVSVSLGAAAPSVAAPVPAAYEDGRATIVLPASEAAGAPRIAGDFTDWRPVAMTRVGGEWRYTVALSPGVYNYAFITPEGEWFVPASTPGRRDDGMGGHVAVLVVE